MGPRGPYPVLAGAAGVAYDGAPYDEVAVALPLTARPTAKAVADKIIGNFIDCFS
jgi:hypothetical protein